MPLEKDPTHGTDLEGSAHFSQESLSAHRAFFSTHELSDHSGLSWEQATSSDNRLSRVQGLMAIEAAYQPVLPFPKLEGSD